MDNLPPEHISSPLCILSTIAQENASAKLPNAECAPLRNTARMADWTLAYIGHILETRNWSMNQLAEKAGVAASTINRPMRQKGAKHSLSRQTIKKIAAASGIDPAPFVPAAMAEEKSIFALQPPRPKTYERRILETLHNPTAEEPAASALPRNEIKIAVVGDLAQIVATVDREGLARLRQKLDALEAMMDP